MLLAQKKTFTTCVCPQAIAWARISEKSSLFFSTDSTIELGSNSAFSTGRSHACNGVGCVNSISNCCSICRSDVKYSSNLSRSADPTLFIISKRSSFTTERTLRRVITLGSGLNSASFGSLKSGPKIRVYNAAGDGCDGFTAPPLRWLQLRWDPSSETSRERKRDLVPTTSAIRVSILGSDSVPIGIDPIVAISSPVL